MPNPQNRKSARPDRVIVALRLGIGLLAVGCSDGRPGADAARADFEKRYPEATVLEVHMSEDEVIARSYRIHYRFNEPAREGVLEIQYMEEGETGRWIARPELPLSLP